MARKIVYWVSTSILSLMLLGSLSYLTGSEQVVAGFAKAAVEICGGARPLASRANGQVAVAYYQRDAKTGRYAPAALDVLTFEGDLIKEITAFVAPDLFPRFGLPASVPG